MSLQLQGIQKSYREPQGALLPVLNIDSFSVDSGEQCVLLGASGGGKTTLLNIISGITLPDSGTVTLDQIEVTRLAEVQRDRLRAQKIGFVFQTFNLLPAFSALENVLLGMSFSGNAPDVAHARQLLSRVGLEQRLSHRPGQLSVGEQQRVAVARALANRPSLLLADEPTASVDLGNQQTILNLIREACSEGQVSLLLVTHSEDVAKEFDRVENLAEFNRRGEGS